jgi:hypothetical protein
VTKERWAYLKALAPPQPRYLHIACYAYMEEMPGTVPGTMTSVPRITRGQSYRKPKPE